MFDIATREKYRFDSSRGQLSVEQLWDVPLRSKRDDFNLDTIAKTLAKQVRESSEESFVDTKENATNKLALAKLEIVKHIINVLLTEEEARANRAKALQERQRLMEALGKKQDAAIDALSADEIKAKLAQLDAK